MNEPRFDFRYGEFGPSIDFHFCRSIEEDGTGCHGSNPDHGMSFEEARAYMVKHLEKHIAYWRGLSLDQWFRDNGMQRE